MKKGYTKGTMTAELAEFVKDLRVNKDYSWRAVSRDYNKKYHNSDDEYGNQFEGIDLCEDARMFYNEEIERGWN